MAFTRVHWFKSCIQDTLSSRALGLAAASKSILHTSLRVACASSDWPESISLVI